MLQQKLRRIKCAIVIKPAKNAFFIAVAADSVLAFLTLGR